MAIEETYATLTEVNTYAEDNGFATEWQAYSSDVQTRALVEATKDIERYHQQVNLDDTLWQLDDGSGSPPSQLLKAAQIQTLFVAKHLSLRDLSDRTQHISGGGNYNDSNITVTEPGKRELHPDAKMYVDRYLRIQGIRTNAFFRG